MCHAWMACHLAKFGYKELPFPIRLIAPEIAVIKIMKRELALLDVSNFIFGSHF